MWSGIWKMRVLVVIPAYNEEESIVRVVENLKQNYEQLDYVMGAKTIRRKSAVRMAIN